jgi:cytidylate kinase
MVSEALSNIKVELRHDNGEQITIMNGKDVSRDIRQNFISDICSITSPYPKCREFVYNIQRKCAEEYDLIMEGRDITSHVLPDAKYKFFLDASVEVRAQRRFNELKEKGQEVTLEQVKEDLIERDRRDSHRELSPLILTEGTYHIDNSNMTIDEEVDLMYRTIMGEIE